MNIKTWIITCKSPSPVFKQDYIIKSTPKQITKQLVEKIHKKFLIENFDSKFKDYFQRSYNQLGLFNKSEIKFINNSSRLKHYTSKLYFSLPEVSWKFLFSASIVFQHIDNILEFNDLKIKTKTVKALLTESNTGIRELAKELIKEN